MLLDAEKKVCSMEMQLSLFKHKEVSFDMAMTAVNRELSAVTVKARLYFGYGTKLF